MNDGECPSGRKRALAFVEVEGWTAGGTKFGCSFRAGQSSPAAEVARRWLITLANELIRPGGLLKRWLTIDWAKFPDAIRMTQQELLLGAREVVLENN